MNQLALDCTSEDSTIRSLAQILSVTRQELRKVQREIPTPPRTEPPEYFVAEKVFAAAQAPSFPVQSLWFHASRVTDPLDFSREGILTKSEMQPRLLRFLKELSSELIRSGNNSFNGPFSEKLR